MSNSAGLAPPPKGLMLSGIVTQVISSTSFKATLQGFGDNYFQGWGISVARKADGTGAAPQGDEQRCGSYVSETGLFTHTPFSAAGLSVGDEVSLIFPQVTENRYIVTQPSANIKQRSDTEVTTTAAALAKVKELAFSGAVGVCRVTFDMKVNTAGGTATAAVYKNGVAVTTDPNSSPKYTEWTDTTGVYHTYTQDIGGLALGDLVQIYAKASAGRTTYIKNFHISYDIVALPVVQAQIDRVYFDGVNGVSGTAWPVGTAEMPCNDEADALAILKDRNLQKIEIVHGKFTLPQNLSWIKFIGNGNINIVAAIFMQNDNIVDLNGHDAKLCSYEDLVVFCPNIASTLSMAVSIHRCSIASAGTSDIDSITLMKDSWMSGMRNLGTLDFVKNSFIDAVTIDFAQFCENSRMVATTSISGIGNCYKCHFKAAVSIDSFGIQDCFDCKIETPLVETADYMDDDDLNFLQACTIDCTSINRNTYLTNCKGQAITLTNLTAAVTLTVSGDVQVTVDASCTAGTINIYGKCKIINNSGGTAVIDKTDNLKAEVPVNINAILAGETDVLNLAAAGSHYTVENLVLKCDDPGANTVLIRLYKLVNGVATLIKTFTVSSGAAAIVRGVSSGHQNYLTVDDLFALPNLVGDNLQITVQASGGGPYAVTGSFSYRSI